MFSSVHTTSPPLLPCTCTAIRNEEDCVSHARRTRRRAQRCSLHILTRCAFNQLQTLIQILLNLPCPALILDPEPRTQNRKLNKATQSCPTCLLPITSTCRPFLPAAAALSRTRARANARPVSAASRDSRGMRRLLPVAVAVVMMLTSAALGVVRAQGVWSTAQLSVARPNLAAASVGKVALFAGGYTGSALLCREWGVRLH